MFGRCPLPASRFPQKRKRFRLFGQRAAVFINKEHREVNKRCPQPGLKAAQNQ